MTGKQRRPRVLAAICGVVTALMVMVYAWKAAPGHDELLLAELGAKNLLIVHGRTLGHDTNLVFIGIDQPNYADLLWPEDIAQSPVLAELTNRFPWSLHVWAQAIDKLVGAGAKVVALDLIFSAPAPGAEELRQALDRHPGKVVIGANFTDGDKSRGSSASITYPSDAVINYSNPTSLWRDDRVGFVNYTADADDRVRKAAFQIRGERGLPPDGTLESFAARILRKSGQAYHLPEDGEAHLFRFSGPPGTYLPTPLYQIFVPAFWTNNFAGGRAFRDKVVMIGPAANIFHDEHASPFPGEAMLGPEIHLNVLAAAARGEFVGETSREADLLSLLAAGALAWALISLVRAPVRRLVAALLVSGAYVLLCRVTFDQANFAFMALSPLLVLNVSTLGGFAYEFVLERMEKNRTRRTLERYVSKDVVRELLDNPQTYLNAIGGTRKPVTILFSDVRGFTTMTEGADPARLVLQLNEYFTEMVAIVFREHGSLDKFIGDAVMALWGSITTLGSERDAQHAVAAALAMRQSLARLNINWKQRGMMELSFGIGLNHGDVIVGNLGSEEKMEVSVIGDAVNLGSRLESLTKEYKLDLLLGENMVPLVQSRFVLRTVDSVQVKGKTKPVHVFTVMADQEAGEQPPPWLARYEEGLQHYRARRFSEGADAFAECSRTVPEDYLCQLYFKRCQELLFNPPGPDWDTVFVMKSK